jgi:hypothetical protein
MRRSSRAFSCLSVLPLLAGLCAVPAFAEGPALLVNEVNVDGLKGQSFEKVNVRIDDKGDIHIDAPGYSVKRVAVNEGKDAAQPDGVITKKYFLLAEQNVRGVTEFDVDVFLNGKFLRTLASGDQQIVSEITKELRPGKNRVILQAKKHLSNKDQPKSTSQAHVFRVIFGEGAITRRPDDPNEEQVVIEKQLITFTRTAAEQNDVTQEFSFTTR